MSLKKYGYFRYCHLWQTYLLNIHFMQTIMINYLHGASLQMYYR